MGMTFDEVLDSRLRKPKERGAVPAPASLKPAAAGAGGSGVVEVDVAEGIDSEQERGGQP
jgi:hypothetical protein